MNYWDNNHTDYILINDVIWGRIMIVYTYFLLIISENTNANIIVDVTKTKLADK